MNEAVPPLLTGTCAKTLVPSWKVTMPVGVVDPGGTEATVAVKVTAWPKFDGLSEELTVVVDALAWIF